MGRSKTMLVVACLAFLLTLPTFAAVQHPNNERGFSPEKSFQVGDLDNVSLFNGGLTITIPIGINYPVGGDFSYQLTLVYNSNLWDWEFVSGGVGLEQSQPRPNLDANAGFGWTLSLGQLHPPTTPPRNDSPYWLYVSSDGAEHRFWDTLHEGEANSAVRWYTRDNSYLRMTEVTGTQRTIEYPDGTIHTFGKAGSIWRINQIADRFGNALNVTYPPNKILLSDTTGRSHEIITTGATVDGLPTKLVTQVKLAKFGGDTANYSLAYSPSENVDRPCPFVPDVFPSGHQSYIPPQANVRFLTSITLPDGSKYEMPTAQYVTSVDAATCKTAGVLEQMRLPTLGYLEWDWSAWALPSGNEPEGCDMHPCGPSPDPTPWLQGSSGVVARRVLNANGTSLGEWKYASQLVQTGNSNRPVEKVTTVTTPLEDKTEHFFSAYIDGNLPNGSPARPEHYSLPFTTRTGDGNGRYLSQKIYDGTGNNLKRTIYVRYEWDAFNSVITFDDLENRSWDFNRRLASQRTDYNSAGVLRDVTNSNFDGLGHYRRVQTSGTTAGGGTRTETTNYNPAAGTFPGSFTLPNTWLLNLYDYTEQIEGNVHARQTYCFDSATGFLRGERRYLDSDNSPDRDHNDVIVLYETSDGKGNRTAETYYGGDNANAPINQGICTVSPSIWSYRQAHTYAFGSRATTQYETAVGSGIGFFSLDQAIDASTGLPRWSRDVSEIKTDYEYDEQGRIEWIKPQGGHGAWIEYQYYRAMSATELARVAIFSRANGSTTNEITRQDVHFDALGRVHLEQDSLGGPSWSVVQTLYDAMGNKTDVSTPYHSSGNPTGWTQFNNYDPFGRSTQTVAPDGLVTTVNYTGDRTVQRTVQIATEVNGQPTLTNALTREDYDKHGRLYKVAETDGATATYTYDVGNRLTKIDMAGASAQSREFIYDNRGFLIEESHPEIGVQTGGGTRTYSGLDAKGHPLNVDTEAGSQLEYTYDKAERVTLVQDDVASQNLLAFNYAASNNNTNLKKGKLELARKFNRLQIPWDPGQTQTVTVAETYEYHGRGGRVSDRTTSVTPLGESFEQSWSYDDLGNVTSIGYPNCTHSACAPSDPTRNLQQTFTRGRLDAIAGFADSITYRTNGMVGTVAHSNGVTETITVANHGMRRPHEISVTYPGGGGPSLGVHSYDGAGNLYARSGAGEAYFYDKASRLKKFRLPGGNSETYFYDAYGNLTRVDFFDGTNTMGTTFAVDSARNRLSGGGVVYDGNGNLRQWGNESYRFDALNAMTHRNFPSESYLYTADGERLATLRYTGGEQSFGSETWTVRGLDGKVLRRWEHTLNTTGAQLFSDGFESGNTSAWDTTVGTLAAPLRPPTTSGTVVTKGDFGGTQGTWTWVKDYIYRDGIMLAAATSETGNDATKHFAVNHLGTPQVTTNAVGGSPEIEHYWGFGGIVGEYEPNDETQRFTGHERDFHFDENENDDLDYMRARYCSPHLRRFLSVDPARSASPKVPQSWNRYSYALNNPVKFVDPDGKIPVIPLAIGLAIGGELFGSSAANTPESEGTKLIDSRMLPLDTMAAEAAGGAVLGKLGAVLKGAFQKVGGFVSGILSKADDVPAGGATARSCFVAGTMVWTRNGLVEIDKVESGTEVWAYDFESGRWVLAQVARTIETQHRGSLLSITTSSGETIEVTGTHPFWVHTGRDLSSRPRAAHVPLGESTGEATGRWVEAKDLQAGDVLASRSGIESSIVQVLRRSVALPVFNLEVAGPHSFAVGSLGVLVHNKAAVASAGNIKVPKKSRLKKLGVDAEGFKADVLSSPSEGSKFNIGINESGEAVLVPVQRGSGKVVETGIPFDALIPLEREP